MSPIGLTSQKSPYVQKLEEDIHILIQLPHLKHLQHPANFSFYDGCKGCTANLNCLLESNTILPVNAPPIIAENKVMSKTPI